MERRKTPRKDWVIGKDEVGRAVLEWKVDSLRLRRTESDPCARTYDFLDRLNAPDLALEDGPVTRGAVRGFNPYERVPAVSGRKKRRDN
jgi:hypothetical protein